jgi:hypothetical protein
MLIRHLRVRLRDRRLRRGGIRFRLTLIGKWRWLLICIMYIRYLRHWLTNCLVLRNLNRCRILYLGVLIMILELLIWVRISRNTLTILRLLRVWMRIRRNWRRRLIRWLLNMMMIRLSKISKNRLSIRIKWIKGWEGESDINVYRIRIIILDEGSGVVEFYLDLVETIYGWTFLFHFWLYHTKGMDCFEAFCSWILLFLL